MIFQKKKLFLIVLFLFFSTYLKASETNEPKLEIKAYSSQIKVGEPLILEIRVIHNKPNISSETGEIITSSGISSPHLIITKKGKEEEIKYEYDSILNKPLPVFDKENKGLEYAGTFIAFYDQNKKGLLFNEPGEYSCRLESTRDKLESNTIEINVKSAPKQDKKALSILTGEFDLFILGYPDSNIELTEFPGVVDRFKQVIEQCPDTILAKMAAARLGIENTKNFEDKYSDNSTFIEQYRKGEIKDPLIESAKKYLSMAYGLPDEIPIRETAIYNLATFELFDGKTTKAFSIYDELATKYPEGKYGKKALRDKKDSQEFIEMHPDLFIAEETQHRGKKPLGVALPIAGAAVAVIVIAGLVLFSRKKKLNKAE